MSREQPPYASRPISQHSSSAYRDNQNNQHFPSSHRSPTSPPGYGYSDRTNQQSSNSQYRDRDYENDYDNPFANSRQNQRGYDDDDNVAGGYTDDQFNVAMDFNNDGPRYAEVYGGQRGEDMAQLAAGARPVSMYAQTVHLCQVELAKVFGILSYRYRQSNFNALEPQASHQSQIHADDRSLHSNSKSTKTGYGGRKPLLENMDSYATGGPYGHGNGLGSKEAGYANGGLEAKGDDVELVTVPALGAE